MVEAYVTGLLLVLATGLAGALLAFFILGILAAVEDVKDTLRRW